MREKRKHYSNQVELKLFKISRKFTQKFFYQQQQQRKTKKEVHIIATPDLILKFFSSSVLLSLFEIVYILAKNKESWREREFVVPMCINYIFLWFYIGIGYCTEEHSFYVKGKNNNRGSTRWRWERVLYLFLAQNHCR